MAPKRARKGRAKGQANDASKHPAKQNKNAEEDVEDDAVDLSKSVLGGMKGGWRLSGDEDESTGIHTFTVPFNDKQLICQRYRDPSQQSDENADTALIFTHGAGGGIANPATTEFAAGFAKVSPVLCFQGTMNLQNRVKCFKTVCEYETEPKALGGRSMGARAAVLTATDQPERYDAVVLVSFPLTSAKGGDSREDILLNLPGSIDVLFVIGDRDAMCNLQKLAGVRRKMKAKSWSIVVQGADHSMSLKQKGGVGTIRAETGRMAAEWLADRDQSKNEAVVCWDQDASEVKTSPWRAGSAVKRSRQAETSGAAEDDEDEQKKGPTKRRRKAKS